MKQHWKDKVIVITGAGSGIGQALAKQLASQGAKLILTDIDEDSLLITTEALGNSVLIARKSDVSAKKDWQKLVGDIKAGPGYIDVLVNNAGISSFGYFDETSEALFNKVMDVNLNGVIIGCREMMPLLEKSSRGLIANVASIFGLITMPMLTPYHASKFAVRGFSEALKQDMVFQKKNIDVVCVMPGGIKTNIASSTQTESFLGKKADFVKHFDKIARTTPEQAAKVIEKGMRHNTFRILIGPDAKLVDWLYKILPTHYDKVFNPLFGVKKLIG